MYTIRFFKSVTVIVQVAVLLPSTVTAVMVVVPAPNEETKPLVETVATLSLLLDQLTVLLVASFGDTVAMS